MRRAQTEAVLPLVLLALAAVFGAQYSRRSTLEWKTERLIEARAEVAQLEREILEMKTLADKVVGR